MFRKRLVKFPLPDLVKGAKNRYGQIKAIRKEKKEGLGEEEGYLVIGRLMISKKFLLFIGVALILVIAAILWIQINRLKESMVRDFFYESTKLADYSGNAKIIGKSGTVIYEGEIKDGICEGSGKLYDFQERPVYEGEFVKNNFEGRGTLYYEDGTIRYEGDFAKNVFEGEGTLYLSHADGTYVTGSFADGEFVRGYGELINEAENFRYIGELSQYAYEGIGRLSDLNSSILIYEGSFKQGAYEGAGKLYDRIWGSLRYEGEFVNNRQEGNGTLYDKESGILYKGEWKGGLYEGDGILYEDGYRYEGSFIAGQYEGKGILYDMIADSIVYEGSFFAGLYEGEGILYDPISRCILYEGGFHKGFYEGMGKLYQTGGELLEFEGSFRAGVIAGEGIFYDKYGRKAVNGSVSNGQLDFLGFLNMEVEKIQEAFYNKLVENNLYEDLPLFDMPLYDMSEEAEEEDEDDEEEGTGLEAETQMEIEMPEVLYAIYTSKAYKVSFVEERISFPGKCAQLFVYDGTVPEQTELSEEGLTKVYGKPVESGYKNADRKEEFILKKLGKDYLTCFYVIAYEYQEMKLSFYFKAKGSTLLFYGCEDTELTENIE